MTLSLALGVAALAGLGAMAPASADFDTRSGHHADRWNGRRGETRARDFTGVWRLETRRGDAAGRWGNGRFGNHQAAYLPEVLQIERARRELRVENRNGRLIRSIETGRGGDWQGNRLEVHRTVRGAKVTEIFSLRRNGRELVVRTIIDGPRGSQQFTSLYDRA